MAGELELNRRDLLRTVAAAGMASSLSTCSVSAQAQPDLIKDENEKPGTMAWINTKVEVDPATKYRSPGIEGYASRTSLRPGESISFHISTNPPSPFTIDLYRMGYYQGQGARHIQTLGPFSGATQADPPIGAMRVRECAWPACTSLTIPPDWVSGVYLGQLTAEKSGLQSYVIFVVRDDRKADFLLQVSDNTWNAYNRWPSQFSLYDDGKAQWYWGPDVQVSFDRPYGKYCQIFNAPLSVGSGEFLLWEFPFTFWAEQRGYDVTYISNVDTHADPAGLKRAKGWISVGHDEYWSLDMFANMKQAVADGLSLGFFSGNSICGVVPMKNSSDQRPHRIIERVGLFGGIDDTANGFPDMKRLTQHGPNESSLIGARSSYPVTGGADWICRKPDHWLFAGTGMKEGDGIPGLVGWEFHGDPAPIPGLEVLASGKTINSGKVEGEYTATIYPGPQGNHVFNASTIWWSDGLSEPPGYLRPSVYASPRGPDSRVQRITANWLDRVRGL